MKDFHVSHFKFEERVIKTAVNYNYQSGAVNQTQNYLMVLTDKTFEICDLNYLIVEADERHAFYREYFIKYRIGFPEIAHICGVKS